MAKSRVLSREFSAASARNSPVFDGDRIELTVAVIRRRTKALLRVQTPCVLGRRIGEVQLRPILHGEHDRVLSHSPLRGLKVRLENLLRRHHVAVEEPIRRQRVAPALTGRVDARFRIRCQGFDHTSTPLVQPLISEVNPSSIIAILKNWQIKTAKFLWRKSLAAGFSRSQLSKDDRLRLTFGDFKSNWPAGAGTTRLDFGCKMASRR